MNQEPIKKTSTIKKTSKNRHKNGYTYSENNGNKNRNANNSKKTGREVQKSHPFRKNDHVVVTVRDIGSSGEGIGFLRIPGGAREDRTAGQEKGLAVFVKDAVPGDTIEAIITKVTARYAYGHLDRILTPSPWRVEPRCPIAKTCGGCQIQALSYEKQLEFKQRKVRESLVRIGGFAPEQIDAVMHPIIGMEDPWHYRNKEQVPVQQGKYGPVTGFYASHSHTVVPMTDCWIGSPQNRQILETILSWMQEHDVPAYDEASGKGLIRHILIRNGIYSGQTMVCIVANDYRIPFEKELVQALNQITSVVLNTNTDRTNVITGRTLRTLWGTDDIEDTLHIYSVHRDKEALIHKGKQRKKSSEITKIPETGEAEDTHNTEGIHNKETEGNDSGRNNILPERIHFEKTEESVTFSISPLSFYQVNPRQTEKLYSLALDCAGLTGKETVWDLYCGVGTISLFMARRAKQVYGVEIVPEAIENARKNAERNGIRNASFYVGKAEEVLPAYVEKLKSRGQDPQIDVICVDPPRKGCDETCIETMLEIAPGRIVYVSCDPATLARDLKKLAAGGYELTYIQPVDQFGHSVHVETVCLMSRIKD